MFRRTVQDRMMLKVPPKRCVCGFVQFWTHLLTKFPHKQAWDWSWAFLVIIQRLATWAMVRRRCEFLIRNGVRIRAHNLRNAVYYINMLNVKYLLFFQICAFCIIIYCHPFLLVIHTQLITSSVPNFMTRFSSFKLRGSGHSQNFFKLQVQVTSLKLVLIECFSGIWFINIL